MIEPEPMREVETNPLIEVEKDVVTEAPRTPASSSSIFQEYQTPITTRRFLGIVAVAVVLLLVAGMITISTSSNSTSSASAEASCQVHDLRAHFKRFNVEWNFTSNQSSSISCHNARATVSMGSSCEFVCSRGFRDSRHRQSDSIKCRQGGEWDFSKTGPQMCIVPPTSTPTAPTKAPTKGTCSPPVRPLAALCPMPCSPCLAAPLPLFAVPRHSGMTERARLPQLQRKRRRRKVGLCTFRNIDYNVFETNCYAARVRSWQWLCGNGSLWFVHAPPRNATKPCWGPGVCLSASGSIIASLVYRSGCWCGHGAANIR